MINLILPLLFVLTVCVVVFTKDGNNHHADDIILDKLRLEKIELYYRLKQHEN